MVSVQYAYIFEPHQKKPVFIIPSNIVLSTTVAHIRSSPLGYLEAGEIIRIHHECSCRIGKSHPRGRNFNQGRGFAGPFPMWLVDMNRLCPYEYKTLQLSSKLQGFLQQLLNWFKAKLLISSLSHIGISCIVELSITNLWARSLPYHTNIILLVEHGFRA